jgi:hypothetical protein
VTGLAQFTRSAENIFVPSEWTVWDRPKDLDFGASTPAFVPIASGANAPGILVAPAKAGHIFLLNGANLSGGTWPSAGGTAGDGSLADLTVANPSSESVYTAPTIYTSASGIHAAINVGDEPNSGQAGNNCPAGTANSSHMVVSVLIQPGQTPLAKEVWCATNAETDGHVNFPPVSTTTDGVSANAMVWFVNNSQLEGVDGDTGKVLVTTKGAACANVPSMSFPIVANNRVVVAALGHLCAWSLGGQ